MVEIIPKPIEKVPSYPKKLFYFFIFLFFSLLISYFILTSLQQKSEALLSNLTETISRGKTSEIISLEKENLNYQRKIQDFLPLLENHKFPSRFFEFFETNTHPRVFFSQINLNSQDSLANLTGQTDSFSTLGQQLLIFEERPEVATPNLTRVSIGKDGKIEFTLNLSFNPKFLTY
jgi:hypothetical protein